VTAIIAESCSMRREARDACYHQEAMKTYGCRDDITRNSGAIARSALQK
jgi:hypothetical protein